MKARILPVFLLTVLAACPGSSDNNDGPGGQEPATPPDTGVAAAPAPAPVDTTTAVVNVDSTMPPAPGSGAAGADSAP